MLDMHKLNLELRRNAKSVQDKKDQKDDIKTSTKLHVKNVAFEVERKDVMGLFKPFGHVVSCRLPKKMDGSHKGYAFINFGTKKEAQNAMEAVHGTHLLGRRLVVEYSIDEEQY
eukprot:TRINITY_DN14252_c0_g1_i2.p2 TRINITY_DN14252_c0_g1~~TRINITY_DN14252_c0_g1_i2.p2  ORF type:complete len:114 (-),score=16.99 TRINITY_DN14252_c0_g1_i2:214-555(-)